MQPHAARAVSASADDDPQFEQLAGRLGKTSNAPVAFTQQRPAKRQHFSISRAAEYFSVSELQAQTGQPRHAFAHVAAKELVDNSLDSSEMAGRAPDIEIASIETPDFVVLSVRDNGEGIPDDVVARIFDFTSRTSNKDAYRSPTRGSQGNAAKCVIGIPTALGASASRLTIEGAGSRHDVRVAVSIAGDLDVAHDCGDGPDGGARIVVGLPNAGVWAPVAWVEQFALFNPHAHFTVTTFRGKSDLRAGWIEQGKSFEALVSDAEEIGKMSWEPSGKANKYNASDPTPAHWYDEPAFQKLAYLRARTEPGLTVKGFIGEFKGASRKAAEIARDFPRLLKDANAKALHRAMLAGTDAPKPETLGRVGKGHFESLLGGAFLVSPCLRDGGRHSLFGRMRPCRHGPAFAGCRLELFAGHGR